MVPRGHRPLRPRRGRPLPAATETMDEIIAFIADLIERGFAYEVEGDVYFRVARFEEYGRLSGQRPGPGRGAGAEPAQGGPARLRALEGEQAGRGHGVGLALGAGPAGLAHRVLGDGREAPRRRRSRSTAAGSTSSSRTTRTSWRSRARAATSSRRSGCTTACSRFTGEKMSKSLGNVETIQEVLDRWGRETTLLFFLTAHWRSPIDFSDETMEQAQRAVRRRFRNGLRRTDEPAPAGEWERFAAALDDDFNTPAGARAHARVAATTDLLRRRSTSSGWHRCADAGRAGRRFASCAERGRRRGRTRLRRGRPAAGRDRGRRLGGAGRGRRLPPRAASVTREQVYGRRPVREALRGPREVLELWATERAVAAEPWLGDGPRVHVKPDREIERGRRDARPPGRARLVRALPLRRRATSSRRRAPAARLPRPGHRPPQPRRRAPERRGSRRDRCRRAGPRLRPCHAGGLPRLRRAPSSICRSPSCRTSPAS